MSHLKAEQLCKGVMSSSVIYTLFCESRCSWYGTLYSMWIENFSQYAYLRTLAFNKVAVSVLTVSGLDDVDVMQILSFLSGAVGQSLLKAQ